MGLREWLVISGVVIVLMLVLDGLRRHYGRNTLKFKLDRKLISQFDNVPDNPEIIGTPRIVSNNEPFVSDSLDDEPLLVATDDQRQPSLQEQYQEELDIAPEQQEIFIIYVEANDPAGFNGQDLLQSVLEGGMRFGEMEIFHRHESMSGNGAKLYSMASAINPGTFDLENMNEFSTRMLCFFMSLPGPKQPKEAFELMLTMARKLASELGGELRDDQRSVLTTQTIEHYRQRIIDFERLHKKLAG